MTITTNPLDGLLLIRNGYPTARWNFQDAVGSSISSPGGIGNAAEVTFSFLTTIPSYFSTAGFAQFSEPQKQAARDVLTSISNVAHINFNEISGVGKMTFGMNAQSGSAGYTYSPSFGYSYSGQTITSVYSTDLAGDVWFNSNHAWTTGDFSIGGSGYGALVHEIGHALGLKHPFEAVSGGYILDVSLDNNKYTVMSYTEHPYSLYRTVTETSPGSFTWHYAYIQPETLMPLDISALQYLYGANKSFHSGNDIYTFNTSRPFIRTIWDGGGNDTLSVSNFSLGCVIDLRAGHFSSIRIPSDPLPKGFTESHSGIYDGTDNLGIAYGVIIENATGGKGNDRLIGNASANVLSGGAGTDTMIGGDGSDAYYVRDSGDVVTESNPSTSVGGTDLVNSYLGSYALGANIENGRILATGTANLIGNNLNNTLYAGIGSNTLNGGLGNDTVSYSYASATVTASLATTSAQLTGSSGLDMLLNIENLTGSGNNDQLIGNSGNNILNGGLGNDTLSGGLGNDTYLINVATDIVTELLGQGTDLIKSAVSHSLVDTDGNGIYGGNVENLTLLGSTAINGTGNNLNNILNGNSAPNILSGNAGTDKLTGGLGADKLTGGANADLFIFISVNDSGTSISRRDSITDFTATEGDKIDLGAIDANTSSVSNDAFTTLQQGASFIGSFVNNASLYFDQSAKILYANNDSDTQADFSISLTGVAGVSLGYFIL